ncbi:MAG TPA: signal peptidase II [Acidimicrobiales bacterium]|nr:signal peptidase II [Acidimicrobiales bacterium]
MQERRTVLPAVAVSRSLAARRLAVPAVAAVVTAGDQASKTWALHHASPPRHVIWTLWFDLTFNSGAAFGLGRGVTPLVEAGVFAVVGGLVVIGRRATLGSSWAVALALGLILGGAAGNLGDRFFRHIPGHPGAVVDFIAVARVGQHDWWPVFNVADSGIVVGVVVIIVYYAFWRRSDESSASDEPVPGPADG